MITLLTDFGTNDYFVPAIKGVILTIQPTASLLDLTHDIPAHDIRHAAFTLGAGYGNFPPGTIHLAVVDPGVGSARRPLVAQAGQHFFVGPDNGLFSFVYAREQAVRVYHAARPEFYRPQPSATFHGRDIFAPLAAWLARGAQPASFGSEITDYIRFAIPQPRIDGHTNTLVGEVLHLDRFGNCLTNFTLNELPLSVALGASPPVLQLAGQTVTQFGTHFAQAAQPDRLFAYLGSAGYWEVALWCASAAARFGIAPGTPVSSTLAKQA